jgi:hypothetical protein
VFAKIKLDWQEFCDPYISGPVLPAEAGSAAWVFLFADNLFILQDTSTPGADI